MQIEPEIPRVMRLWLWKRCGWTKKRMVSEQIPLQGAMSGLGAGDLLKMFWCKNLYDIGRDPHQQLARDYVAASFKASQHCGTERGCGGQSPGEVGTCKYIHMVGRGVRYTHSHLEKHMTLAWWNANTRTPGESHPLTQNHTHCAVHRTESLCLQPDSRWFEPDLSRTATCPWALEQSP